MKHLQLTFIVLSFLLYACGSETMPNERELPQAYSGNASAGAFPFETQALSRSTEGCRGDSANCAVFKAAYPLIVSGSPAAQRINDSIRAAVRQAMAVFSATPEEVPDSLESIAEQFLQEYRIAQQEDPGVEMQWIDELEGEVLHQTDTTLSVQLKTYSFAGGAHPNTFVTLMVFDKRSGRKLSLEELVEDMPRLRQLAEQAFRETRDIPQGESLDEAGFFWGEGFQLPEDFAMARDGLLLHYNPYDVAPYVLGPTQFTIPYEKL